MSRRLVGDGSMEYEREFLFPHQDAGELAREGIGDAVVTPYNRLLIEADGQTVLVDTGMGSSGGPDAGGLLASLALEGLAPDDIDVVVITHGYHFGAGAPAPRRSAR